MRKNHRAGLRLIDDRARLAARAWQRFTFGRPRASQRWLDLVEAFVGDTRPRNAERTAAVVLLALDNCRDWEDLVDGGWIFLITVHVYVHFEGTGVGAMRALGIVDRFLQWLGRRDDLHEWDLACLRSRLDQQRSANGGKPRGVPEAYDLAASGSNGREALIERFVNEAELGVAPEVAESMIGLLASATQLRGTDVIRFGALEPLGLWALTRRGDLDDVSPAEADRFVRELARVGASFFGWLADHAHLEPTRARKLQGELLAVASHPPTGCA